MAAVRQHRDNIEKRIRAMCERVEEIQESDLYLYNIPVSELRGGCRVIVDGEEMLMFASYSYLGLIGHPRITKAATDAVRKYGTGTHGVRSLAGTLDLHRQMEAKIAEFKGCDAAVTFSSGYVTNLTTISTLVGRHDFVFSDKLNHASIVDGCLLSGAEFVRFRHNDMDDLKQRLESVPDDAAKLVVTDAVFSMDGDIIDLPALSSLCRQHGAWLMVDEAHSLGVLGKTGHGIEEHFGLEGAIDIKMGTLSKTIPSVGGYIAGDHDLIRYLRHQSRAYIFSAALPPAQAAAALESFRVIEDEPWRAEAVQRNSRLFIEGLKAAGLNTLNTETAIVPVMCGSDESAFQVAKDSHEEGMFVLPVISPAVPEGQARLRATVTAAHEPEQIERAVDVITRAAHRHGVL
ncbi:MAG: aminotransferase class I/II-fold pyridoxal phosphate-dependent enzyme [Anaerolineales bacterium]